MEQSNTPERKDILVKPRCHRRRAVSIIVKARPCRVHGAQVALVVGRGCGLDPSRSRPDLPTSTSARPRALSSALPTNSGGRTGGMGQAEDGENRESTEKMCRRRDMPGVQAAASGFIPGGTSPSPRYAPNRSLPSPEKRDQEVAADLEARL